MMQIQPAFTLSLDSPYSDLSTTGGKGHNLSILSRDGSSIPVPPGFVVTTAAYHDFVNQDDKLLLKEIETELNQVQKYATLEATSTTIRTAFRKRRLSNALQAEIVDRLASLFPDPTQHVAVRSSATCEDMPGASFAGQHDTYLNVPLTTSAVCQSIVDCFSSLFTSRAISYRERSGLTYEDASMAVVVQAMVQSQQNSGVLFTANPLTGRRNESVLEAIPGLGEALVSGLTEPDRYVVVRRADGTMDHIDDVRIGAKAKVIRPVEGGGVKEETLSTYGEAGVPSSAVLTDDDVERIIRTGQEVEAVFDGEPQDIEWAQSLDGKIFVVQSRPITTLFPLPNVPAEPFQVFFSFNAGKKALLIIVLINRYAVVIVSMLFHVN